MRPYIFEWSAHRDVGEASHLIRRNLFIEIQKVGLGSSSLAMLQMEAPLLISYIYSIKPLHMPRVKGLSAAKVEKKTHLLFWWKCTSSISILCSTKYHTIHRIIPAKEFSCFPVAARPGGFYSFLYYISLLAITVFLVLRTFYRFVVIL